MYWMSAAHAQHCRGFANVPLVPQILGYGPHDMFPGWVWIAHSTHVTVELMRQYMLEVLLPGQARLAKKCVPRDAKLPEPGLSLFDGESEPVGYLPARRLADTDRETPAA
jgi:hypothetical protein